MIINVIYEASWRNRVILNKLILH